MICDTCHTFTTLGPCPKCAADATSHTSESIDRAAVSPGRFMLHGLPVVIENPRGSTRSGVDKKGQAWSTTMTAHYGYVAKTADGSADGDHHDVFIGPLPDSPMVFVIDQVDPDTGLFDEHKSILGCLSERQAVDLYHANYQPGWKGFAGVTALTIPDFKAFLADPSRSAFPLSLNWRNGKDEEDGFAPSEAMRSACRHGLRLKKEGRGGDGLLPVTVDWARRIAGGERVTHDKAIKMAAWFARHSVDKRDGWDTAGKESPGYVAYLLWGGEAGKQQSTAYRARIGGDDMEDDDIDGDAKNLTKEQREAIALEDFGWPDERKYPCRNQRECDAAFRLVGRAPAEKQASIKRRLIAIAKRRGLTLPETVQGDDIEPECPECGVVLEWGGESCNRCGCTKEPVMPTGKRLADLKAGTVAQVDSVTQQETILLTGDDYRIVSDNAGLLRVRQLATIADSINENNRLYTRAALARAVPIADRRARSGAMLSELRHPSVVMADNEEKFVDNGPDNKTARIDSWEGPLPDGSVWITRTLLDTAVGRQVASAYRSGKPVGISVRWKMKGDTKTVNGRRVFVASDLDVLTVDDVENPAVPQVRTQYHLLTDEQRDQLGLSDERPQSGGTLTTAAKQEFSRDSSSPAPDVRERKTMKDAISKQLGRLRVLIAAQDAVQAKTVCDNIKRRLVDAMDDGEDVTAEADSFKVLYDEAMKLPGYRAGDAPGAVPGGMTGSPNEAGWGKDSGVNAMMPNGQAATDPDDDSGKQGMKGDNLTFEQWQRQQFELAKQGQAEAKRRNAIQAAIDGLKETTLKGIPEADAEIIINAVVDSAQDVNAATRLLTAQADLYSRTSADARLHTMGYRPGQGGVSGTTISNFQDRPSTLMETVDKLLAAGDDFVRNQPSYGIDPDDAVQQSIRKHNRAILDRMLQGWIAAKTNANNPGEFAAMMDDKAGPNSHALVDSILGDAGRAAVDATTLSNLYNQPAVLMALLVQQFQDLESLNFVEAIGPGATNVSSSSPFWEQTGHSGEGLIGSVLRIPVETWTDPSGFGQFGPQDDMGLLTPEDYGIDEGTPNLRWYPFAPVWRKIAGQITRESIVALGNGPLNYSAVGRLLFHLGYKKSRVIDRAILDEMTLTSDEYGAVAVVGESVTLANNSAYLAGGSVTVNLNTAKNASATVAATDPSVTYGTSVIGAVRIKGGAPTGGYSTVAAGTYCGSANGVSPIVPQRVTYDLSSAGQLQTTIVNTIAVTAPASMIQGWIGSDGNIKAFPAGHPLYVAGTPTFAVDYNNGVILFASGVSGSSGIISTSVTLTYSYGVNYDDFTVNNPTVPTGYTLQDYYDGLVALFDNTAAVMGSSSRFVKPNLAWMSLKASAYITQAKIFYNLNSPKGTELFPTEQYFANRTGINMARINAPCRVGDTRIQLYRKGGTKYGVQTPFEIFGPYPAYDSNQKIKANNIYYGQENSVICSPQVKDTSGNIINPLGRSIRLR